MFVDSGCSAAPWRAALRFSGGERLGLFASEGSTANRPHPPRLRLEPSGKESGSVSKPCTPVVHIKIAGKLMFIPLKMVIGIDPIPIWTSRKDW